MPFFVPKISLSRAASLFGKPKITMPSNAPTPEEVVDDFMERVHEIERQNAEGFLGMLLYNIETDKYNLKKSETDIMLHDDGSIPSINPEALVEGLVIDGNTVYISGEKMPSGISFSDLAYLLEYGRKDKGIAPRDVFRKTFAEYKKQAVQNILDF